MKDNNAKTNNTCGYAPINGLNMYYEIEGTGDPLVYIPAAFGVAGLNSFPALVQSRSVITVDLQGHGRTADIPERPLTLQQHAKDVVGLLKHLGITKADFLGESYGGAIATIIALHHPELGRIATYGATFGPPQVAVDSEMLRFSVPPTPDSRSFQFQRENYKKVAPDPDYWPTFLGKMGSIEWNGFSNEKLASIKARVLIAVGDHDFVRVEHAVETFRAIPNAELAVIPDAGHYVLHCMGRKTTSLAAIPVRRDHLGQHWKSSPDLWSLREATETVCGGRATRGADQCLRWLMYAGKTARKCSPSSIRKTEPAGPLEESSAATQAMRQQNRRGYERRMDASSPSLMTCQWVRSSSVRISPRVTMPGGVEI